MSSGNSKGLQRPFIISVIVTLVLATISGGGSAITASDAPLPTPGVERSYENPFRVLVSDDPDPDRELTSVPGYTVSLDGLQRAERTVAPAPRLIDDGNLLARDAALASRETDFYRRTLADRVVVPTRDRWVPLTDWWDTEVRIYPVFDRDADQDTARGLSRDGQYTVTVQHPNGWWVPVYDADIGADAGALTVTNPDEALVLSTYSTTLRERKLDVVEAYLRHSALAPSDQAAGRTSALPLENGSRVFPTERGGRIPRKWGGETKPIVRNAYVGVIDASPGVSYRDRLVVPSQQTAVYVPWDYRLRRPNSVTETSSCTEEIVVQDGNETENGNETVTKIVEHRLERWANYKFINTDAAVTSVELGPVAMDRLRPGLWSTIDADTSVRRPLPVGSYVLTARLNVTVTVRERWGVRSRECPTYTGERRHSRTVVVEHSIPVDVVDSSSMTVDVEVFDGPRTDTVVVEWSGSQALDPGATAWEKVSVTVGEGADATTVVLTGPWRVFSTGRNSGVNERSRGQRTTVPANDDVSGAYPRLLWDRVGVTNVSARPTDDELAPIWWTRTATSPVGTVAGDLPEMVTDGDTTVPVFETVVGDLSGVGIDQNSPVTAEARDIWGFPIKTTVSRTTVRDSALSLVVDEQTQTVTATLVGSDGRPLPGRPLVVDGAAVEAVETDTTGQATFQATGGVVRARFTGDSWRESPIRHYGPATATAVTASGFLLPITGVVGLIDASVSWGLIIVEWIALLLLVAAWRWGAGRDRP